MLFTKSILRERESLDGVRISVMSKHTLNDGVTLDPRIRVDLYDEHLVQLAPHLRLIGDYYKRGLSWGDFEIRYLTQIRSVETYEIVRRLSIRALSESVTLLCIEDTPEFCHRRLLAEECQRIQENLIVVHR